MLLFECPIKPSIDHFMMCPDEAQDDNPDDQSGDQPQGGTDPGAGSSQEENNNKVIKRRGGAVGTFRDTSSTLASVDSLRAKAVELTFEADPLFGKTSKLFDESSAAGVERLQRIW